MIRVYELRVGDTLWQQGRRQGQVIQVINLIAHRKLYLQDGLTHMLYPADMLIDATHLELPGKPGCDPVLVECAYTYWTQFSRLHPDSAMAIRYDHWLKRMMRTASREVIYAYDLAFMKGAI